MRRNVLNTKTLGRFFALIIFIGCITSILINERKHIQKINIEAKENCFLRYNINLAHSHMIELATLGECVITWNKSYCENYHKRIQQTEFTLQRLKSHCKDCKFSNSIDTLRKLLTEKEVNLQKIMQCFENQKDIEDLLTNQLPAVVKRASRIYTIERKKKGIGGFLGMKEKVLTMPSSKELNIFSDSLVTMQIKQLQATNTYADSLRMRNRRINKTFERLVDYLENDLREKEQKITNVYDCSFRLYSIIFLAIILILFIFFFIERNVMLKRKREELLMRLQEIISQNEELTKEKQNIMQTITHELRSPLSAIHGYAEMIAMNEESPLCSRHAETIQDASERMAIMIDTLLNYFRLDSGKEIVHLLPFKLKNIADTLETEFRPQMEKKKLLFEVTNETDEVVMGDRNLILRIGSNLLSNALKFTIEGKVRLSTKYSDGDFILTVDDTGTGINKEKREQIFKPFERLSNASTQDGFGLGLAIVRSLTELMDGNITVESVPEKGSRFTVTLPLKIADGTEKQPFSNGTTCHISCCSVLSIDNDQMILGMLHDMFEQNGVNCETCTNVIQLTEKLRGNHYDLLTTDLKMSDISGYEVLELLRSSDIGNSRTIPIVAITGSDSITEEELEQDGFSAVLFKPFSMNELLAVTKRCIEDKQMRYIDLAPLFVYGNKQYRLECLINETEKEMVVLSEAMNDADYDKIDNWIHHIRSSWMLIKAEQPLEELYEAIHKNRTMEEIHAKVKNVLMQGKKIIRLAKKEKEKTKWE